MTSKSEHFSLISNPPPTMLRVVAWMVPPPQKDVLKHDTCGRDDLIGYRVFTDVIKLR